MFLLLALALLGTTAAHPAVDQQAVLRFKAAMASPVPAAPSGPEARRAIDSAVQHATMSKTSNVPEPAASAVHDLATLERGDLLYALTLMERSSAAGFGKKTSVLDALLQRLHGDHSSLALFTDTINARLALGMPGLESLYEARLAALTAKNPKLKPFKLAKRAQRDAETELARIAKDLAQYLGYKEAYGLRDLGHKAAEAAKWTGIVITAPVWYPLSLLFFGGSLGL